MKRLTEIMNPGHFNTARNVLLKTIQDQQPPLTAAATKSFLIAKFNDANTFYKHLTGLDELEYYQDRVIELQNSLTEAQLKRRELSYILNDVRNKSIEIQDRLHKVKRHEDPAFFLELMREETDFIKKEREIFASLNEQERYERDVFTAFTNAIRDSQEKQRNRLEYAKYIGFGLTLLGALGSYLVTTWRTEDLKSMIRGSIKEDVQLAFVESAKTNVDLMREISTQQITSQTQELQGLFVKLSAEIERGKEHPIEVVHLEPKQDFNVVKWTGIAVIGYLVFSSLLNITR